MKNAIPLCGECGEVVNPVTFEGCKCKAEIDFPATCDAHWSSGPVPCCEKHARELVALGKFMGIHVPVTKLTEPANCSNCENAKVPD